MTLMTPIFDLKEFDSVYEPSEDTFLLLDALESELAYIDALKPLCLVEVGSGSGVVVTSLASHLQNRVLCFATDINPNACLCSLKTGALNNVFVQCVNMNLLTSFKNTIFDLIVFNPPYVCTEDNEISSNVNRAWAGGKDGRIIIDQFLSQLELFLNSKGVCYMIAIKENKPYNIIDKMSKCNFDVRIIKERKILGEHLFVLRFKKI